MPIVKITTIKVGERQREDYGDLNSLAQSLADPRFGQLQPVVVDQNMNLVAGGRRLAAATLLFQAGGKIAGRELGEIWVEPKEVLSPLHHQLMELEENIQRLDLPWQEKQKAIAGIHKIKVATEPGWDVEKTAELIGGSKRTVYNAVELSTAIDNHPDVAKADTAAGAMMRLARIKDLKNREDEIRVAQLAVGVGMKSDTTATIVHGDALEGLRGLDAESVDGVIMNPPFGVDIEQLFTSGRHIYEDKRDDMVFLVNQVITEAYRVLKPDRWMVIFYPTARLEDMKGVGAEMWERIANVIANTHNTDDTRKINDLLEPVCAGALRRAGFTFQQVPSVWTKPNKRVSALGDPYAQLNIAYENFYFARKGKAILRQIPHSNVFDFEIPEAATKIHPLEMPVDLWETILRAIAVTGETVVEPFAGSGSGGEAAIRCGLNYTGWELDNEFALHAQVRLVGALNTKLKPASMQPKELKKDGQVVVDVSGFDQSLFGQPFKS